MRAFTLLLAMLATLAAALALPEPARAYLSIDEARETCITHIRPQVWRCVARQMLARGGPPRMYVPQCREPVQEQMRVCIMSRLRDSGHPLLAGRPLPGPDAICPLGFDGCMNRCWRVGGWGGAGPAHTCGRVCARRCGSFVRREAPDREARADEPVPTRAVRQELIGVGGF